MSTVIFDFDSTLITLESLEEILADQCRKQPGLEARIREITDLGMAGSIDFQQSLSRRLQLASPTLADVCAFGQRGIQLLTPGMRDLVSWLLDRGADVRIVSGGLREAIVPVALDLGIAADHVHAVSLLWDESGSFAGIDPDDPFSRSKSEGVSAWIKKTPTPRIAVGDGMTDYYLLRDGLVDHFVAFTENVRREAVTAVSKLEARDVASLRQLLENLL